MMKKTGVVCFALILTCLVGRAYDGTAAQRYLKLYAQCDGKQIGKALFMLPSDEFIGKIKDGEDIFVLDVRTKAEERIIGVNLPGTLHVPMNKVFEESTLSKLPKDRQILVVCQTGVRSAIITMGLRDIGFDRTFVLKSGMIGLIEFLSPKEAGAAQSAEGKKWESSRVLECESSKVLEF